MKIICISGSGRSGSTVLSLLLGQSMQLFNLGQTRDIWRSYLNNETCSCDSRLQSCSIWAPIFTRFASSGSRVRLAEMQKLMSAFFKSACDLQDWSERDGLAILAADHRLFLDKLARFFQLCSASSGCDTLLDASKSPEFALACSLLPGVELYVLNMLRDPRAVACSWEKRKGHHAALRFTKLWRERQQQLALWSAVLQERYLLLRYEDFCAQPQGTIAKVLRWSGLDIPADLFSSGSHAEISWERQHIYPPGNEKLLQNKATSLDIIRADAWQGEQNRKLHLQVERMLAEQMTLYNYLPGVHVGDYS